MSNVEPDLDPMQVLLFRSIGDRLQSMGLGGLFSWTNGRPGGWLWDTIVQGDFTTPEEVQLLLEGRPEFQNRFPALFELRRRAAAGEVVQVLSPAEIIAIENQMGEIARLYNMPREMFDNPVEDFQTHIGRGMSIRQFDQRIRVSYNRVANLDPAIKDYFKKEYGVLDDRMLAAFYLDPDKFETKLDLFSRAGAIGGISARYGFHVTRETAEDLAAAGFDENARQQIARVAESDLFRETITEGATDLRAGEEGIRAELATDTAAMKSVNERRATRAAAFQGGGGAVRTEEGYGVGEAT